jgi:hypothetical protein
MSTYFSYFPSMLYGNTAVTNLISKIRVDETVLSQVEVFHPYTLKEGERADQVADFFYGDSALEWVIYLCNNITDPLNEWPKSSGTMQLFLNKKYGSEANAQIGIAYYENNWATDESVISTAAYAALATNVKKYWNPILDVNNKIKNYERKVNDGVSETNQIISLSGAFSGLKEGDVIKQSASVMGTVNFANTSSVLIKHVSGTWANNTSVYKALSNTVVNASITSVSTVIQNIPINEIPYWNAVTYYDVEHNLNEARKIIRLISPSYINQVERDMKRLLSA